jgi:Fanconi-associated nuclease 1
VADPISAAMELQKLGLVSLIAGNSSPLVNVPRASAAAAKEEVFSIDWSEVAHVLPVPELQSVLSRLLVVNTAKNNGGASRSKASKTNFSKESVGGFSTPLPPTTRAAALATLQRRAETSPTSRAAVLRELLVSSGPILKILSSSYKALERLQRLFFLNEGHSLGQFLAIDAGVVKYPSYPITRQSPAFLTREDFLSYELALKQADVLTTALEEGDLEAAEAAVAPAWAAIDAGQHKEQPKLQQLHPQPPSGSGSSELSPLLLRRFSAPWVYCMMATAGVSILEKQKRYRDAAERLQQLLGGNCCPSRRGTWWLRLSTDLEHLGRSNDALEIGEAALADDSLSPGDRLAVQRRVLRLGKPPRRWKKPSWAAAAQREPREVRIIGRPLSNHTGIKSKFYGFDGEQCSVEELALQYYATVTGGEFTGAHTEGGIWATLFGLLLWPQLFSLPVPDAFRTPFQTAPLDLDTDGFYTARMPEIEAQLSLIANGAGSAILESIWEEHFSTLCRGVNWERWTLEELQCIVNCVGGPGLAAVCRLLAQDLDRGGMPDLLLWHPLEQKAKIVEVKGPRDRLSDTQRAWIAAMEDAGLDVEVLKVVEPK